MPHLSKHLVDPLIMKDLEERVTSLMNEAGSKTRKNVFKEICTSTERLMMAKRLALIFLITHDVPTYTITKFLKVSSSTVLRFMEQINRGSYRKSIIWVKNEKIHRGLRGVLRDMFSIFFEPQKHEFVNDFVGKKSRFKK